MLGSFGAMATCCLVQGISNHLPKRSRSHDIIQFAEETDQCLYPLESQLSLSMRDYAVALNNFWFHLSMPIRHLARHLPLSYMPPVVSRLAKMKQAPCALPVWNDEHQMQNTTKSAMLACERDREALWGPVLLALWLSMPAIPFFFYMVFIRCKRQRRVYVGQPWSIKALIPIFVMYHIVHNMILCVITVVAVVYGYMTQGFNWDWELWNVWLTWLMSVVSVTSFIRYCNNRGVILDFPIAGILTLLLPGIGNDVHLAKDWLFIGFCLQKCLCPAWGLDAYVAGLLGIFSVMLVFLPLTLSFSYPEESHAAATYIESHWPTMMATPAVPVPSKDWQEWCMAKLIPQVSYSKQLSAQANDLPQAVLEVMFGLYFGFTYSLIGLLLVSVAKPVLIPRFRAFIAAWILARADNEVYVNAIVAYYKANGNKADFGGQDPMKLCLTDHRFAVVAPPLLEMVGNTAEIDREWQTRLSKKLANLPTAVLVANKLWQAGFDTSELKKTGFTAGQLKEAGFTVGQLAATGFTAIELKAVGFTAESLQQAGFSAIHLKDAGFTAWQLKEAGFTAEFLRGAGFVAMELKEAGFTAGLLAGAGFTATQLKAGGFSAVLLRHNAGFSAMELKEAGFVTAQLKEAGFSAGSLKEAGFGGSDLKRAGYTLQQLKEQGITLRQAGFTVKELSERYSRQQLKEAGITLKEEGFTVWELRSQFTARRLREEGFTVKDLYKEGRFSKQDLKEAGYSREELQGYFFFVGKM